MTFEASHPDLSRLATQAHNTYSTVEQAVTAALRDAILSGIFQPGDKLRQQYLATELMVSRVPVAAALRTLEGEGLVASAPHRGARVRIIQPAEIEETYQLRILLESYAVRLAIQRVTDGEVDELADLAREIDGAGDGDEARVMTEQLYRRLYTIADCPLTADIIARLRANVGRYWLGLRVVHHSHSSHSIIVDAIRARDAARAEEWIARHLTKVSTELQQRITRHRPGLPA